MSHAYLLEGRNHVATLEETMGFAKALLCRDPRPEACGVCSSCVKFDAKSHGDFIWIEPINNNIAIDVIRELSSSMSRSPLEGKRKVFLIERGDLLRQESANALLKTLEEPPEYGVILITAANKDLLRPTILSRCQVVYVEGKEEVPTTIDRKKLFDLLVAVCSGDVLQAFTAKALIDEYKDVKWDFFECVQLFFRDVLIYKVQGGAAKLANGEYLLPIKKCQFLREEQLESILHQVDDMTGLLKVNVNFQIAVETLFLNILEEVNQ